MKLKRETIEWAIKHLDKENDTDIFPKPLELEIIKNNSNLIVDELSKIDIGLYKWNLSRRFIIPKDELSHRVITQLDPIDSIFLSGILKEYGQKIEDKRVTESDNVVFGNRFSPSTDGLLYKSDSQWTKFWKTNLSKINNYKYALRFDIADFYNQIYHHTIENKLIDCDFPNEVKNSISNLLSTVTLKVSRGIPVGPHSTHLLAELALIPIDNSMKTRGIVYTRFMDDFVAFCNSKLECQIILNKAAEILDKQERLILQRFKTKIFTKIEFIEECNSHLNYWTLNETEEKILKIVNDYSDDSPYGNKIDWDELDDSKKEFFSKLYYDKLINEYLNESPNPNYSKLRWIYRKLKQIGVPYAIDFSIENFDKLAPVINDVCQYLVSAIPNYTGDISMKGEEIHKLLESELVKSSEYFQLSLINLFSKSTELNHFPVFASKFDNVSDNQKRKILFIAMSNGSSDWIREIKEKYNSMNTWTKRAFLIACSILPKDERKFFYVTALKYLNKNDLVENTIIKWGKER